MNIPSNPSPLGVPPGNSPNSSPTGETRGAVPAPGAESGENDQLNAVVNRLGSVSIGATSDTSSPSISPSSLSRKRRGSPVSSSDDDSAKEATTPKKMRKLPPKLLLDKITPTDNAPAKEPPPAPDGKNDNKQHFSW